MPSRPRCNLLIQTPSVLAGLSACRQALPACRVPRHLHGAPRLRIIAAGFRDLAPVGHRNNHIRHLRPTSAIYINEHHYTWDASVFGDFRHSISPTLASFPPTFNRVLSHDLSETWLTLPNHLYGGIGCAAKTTCAQTGLPFHAKRSPRFCQMTTVSGDCNFYSFAIWPVIPNIHNGVHQPFRFAVVALESGNDDSQPFSRSSAVVT